MPFQSEKQRRFLHANHPEIAKRWEREYATGGISNHFRKKIKGQPHMLAYITPNEAKKLEAAGGQETMTPEGIPAYPEWDSAYGAESKESFDAGIAPKGTWGGGGGDGGGPPIILNPPPKGPSPAELAAAKAKAEAEKRALEAGAKKKHLIDFKDRQKKKLKFKSKFDTPAWDTDIAEISLYDKNKTIDDYINLLDDEKELNFFEKQHLQELENLERIKFEDQFKEDVEVEDDTPGGYIERENRKFHKLAMVTDKQKKAIKDKMNMLNRGLIDTKTVYDNTKIHDDRGSTGVWGIGAREAEPMSIKEFNKELKDQGYTGTDFIPEVTAVGAKGGVARKNYFHGGILDINESEEIISDDGNDIELTAYNAAFDEPTGVKSLFMKKGGNVRLGPHTATDLLAKKNPDGTRSKYQPPGHATEAESRAYHSPAPSFEGGADQEDDVAEMMSNMGLTQDHSPDYGRGWVPSEDEETERGGADYIGPKDEVRIHNEIIARKNKFDSTWEKTKRVGSVMSSFFSITNPLGFAKFVYDQNKKKNERIAEIEADLELLDKIGATKFTPHTDTIYQTLEQEKLNLLQPKTPDDNDGRDGPKPIYNPVSGEVSEEYAQGLISPRDYMAEIRARQAARDAAVPDWQLTAEERELKNNPIVLTANSGGLANLFRVKNQ